MKKFHHVVAYEGRSVNAQLVLYIRNSVARFEKEHGEITVSCDDKESNNGK